jgi:alcohol dehydrogenase
MNALVFHGPGKRSWEEHPRPVLRDATDAIVKITTTTICGSDLHILGGDVASVSPGRVLGHEGVGVVVAVGLGVTTFAVGDRVILSCITSCGRCAACKRAMYSHCAVGGWLLGNTLDGTQADYVRVPYADTSMHRVPAGVDEGALVMLSDILPTSFECGVRNGRVKPGDTVAIIGAGPIGLAAVLTAKLYSPAEIIVVDNDENRLRAARELGATRAVHNGDGKAEARILGLTEQRGVDVAIEAVGIPATFELCQAIVAAGGHLANVGVHGKSVLLDLARLWSHNVTITTGLVDTHSTPTLLKMVTAGRLKPAQLVTHEFKLDEAMKAYDVFAHAAREAAIKVVLKTA